MRKCERAQPPACGTDYIPTDPAARRQQPLLPDPPRPLRVWINGDRDRRAQAHPRDHE